MIAALRSELVKLRRRRVVVVTAVTTLIFSIGSAAIVLASASRTANPAGRGVTFQALAQPGGGTEVFTTAVSFAGTFLFVVFVGAVAVEFSRGTFRTMLLHEPRRLRLLPGRWPASCCSPRSCSPLRSQSPGSRPRCSPRRRTSRPASGSCSSSLPSMPATAG